LIEVFDFLYAEGQRVNAELSRLRGGQTEVFDLEKHILTRNIFGVDVNAEAVEITKLSLWLKTANKGKELTDLDANIKCGNSLVDDVNVAGAAAFDWNVQFASVMEQGGFDVIMGNPPYGAELREKEWLKIQYARTSFGNIDSYKYFVERAISLLRKSGNWGFILPDSYLAKDYFSDLRKLVVESSSSIKNVKLGDGIFEDVNLPTAILLANKDIEAQEKQFSFRDLSNIEPLEKRIQELTEQSFEIYSTPDFQHTFMTKQSRINREGCVNLIDVYEQVMGVKVYQVGKGKPKQTKQEMDNDMFVSKTKLDESYLPFISQGILRYNYENQSEFIRYGEWLAEPRDVRYFTNPKIVVREIVNPRIYATYIEEVGVVKNIAAVIIAKTLDFDLKYLLALLNSQLFTYFLMTESPKSANQSYPSFSSRIVKELPIKQIALPVQQPFITHAETMLTTTRSLSDLRKRVLTLLLTKTGIQKPSAKLQEWDALTWAELEAEFRKAKVKLSLNDQEELLQYFEQKKAEAERLKTVLATTDRAIDAMVYELYGLTAEEIRVVEGGA
jgi:type I restriction-modification system DNA methylase subunit